MNKRIKLLALAGAWAMGSVLASEYRTPYLAENGPLRYDFFRLSKKEGEDRTWNFNMWKSMHAKQAHRAFLKHSTDSHPLTALIFNKADFRFKDIFPDAKVPFEAENYSPFLKILKYSPRASYYECGISMGASFDMEVWEGKGRVGVRASVPVRHVEIERKDDTDKMQDPRALVTDADVMQVNVTSAGVKGTLTASTIRDLIDSNNADQLDTSSLAADSAELTIVTAINNQIDAIAGNNNKISYKKRLKQDWDLRANSAEAENVITKAYRFDFVRNMIDANRQSIVQGSDKNLKIFGNNLAGANPIANAATGALQSAQPSAMAGLVANNPVSGDPLMHAYQVIAGVTNEAFDRADKIVTSKGLKKLEASGFVGGDAVYYFQNDVDYSKLIENLDKRSTTCPCTDGPETNEPWLVFRRQADSSEDDLRFGNGKLGLAGTGSVVARRLEDYMAIYDNDGHPLLQLAKCGIEFETDRKSGLGDLDLDLFYNHTFGDDLAAEIFFGVRFPTASNHDNDKTANPYKTHLGNGGHFELKLGGFVAWQPLDWMNLKADARYSFVLEAKEHRMAVFKGSCVKNIGPCADADVDWGYFIGRLDLNFFHPDCCDLGGTLGYEFYYKSKDKVCFKAKTMESCLGKKWEVPAVDSGTGLRDRKLVENPVELSGSAAAKNTEALSHKVRGEISYRLHCCVDFYCGGSYTFAGQNAFKDCDAHAGFNVRF